MLNVLIADDEPIVRAGLHSVLQWEEQGFFICGDAEDGEDAIQKIVELRPDIAIVDIHMPEKDGLAVSEYVKNHKLPTKIVFLTGFDEFTYARRAIDFGVKAYLLKPVDEENLLEIMLALGEEIRSEKRSSTLARMGAETTYGSLMENILTGERILESSALIRELYDVSLDWDTYQIALVREGLDADRQRGMTRRIREFLRERDMGVCFELNRRIVILLKNRALDHEHRDALELSAAMNAGEPGTAQLILSECCGCLAELHRSYNQAVSLTDKSFLLRGKPIVYAAMAGGGNPGDVEVTASNLAEHIRSLSEEEILADVERIRRFLMERPMSMSRREVGSFYASLLTAVSNSLNLGGMEGSFLLEVYSLHRDIPELGSIGEMERYVTGRLLELMRHQADKLSAGPLSPILAYIQSHLDQDVKLKTLAEQFSYNSAYLGKLFKTRTGVAFNDYVDRLKMEKARGYIQEGHMVYEAAKLVGYTNINYFNSKFKKFAGVSPGSVRKKAKQHPALFID